MRLFAFLIAIFLPAVGFAGNTYIEFGQFEKVRRISITAGALYACSKDKSLEWPKRAAYQFFHFRGRSGSGLWN